MEGFDKKDEMHEGDSKFREEIFSKAVRAGKRTYFFDVKSTRNDEYYLTITESKKRYDQEGNFHFEKHKVFLYKEDFEKFADGLSDVVNKIKELNESGEFKSESDDPVENYSEEVSFDDL